MAPDSEVHKRLFLYSHPRTRSNLFIRLLETHPQMMTKQYPFMFAFQAGPEGHWPEEKRAKRIAGSHMSKEEADKKTYQAGLDEMETVLAKANEEGKICTIKEHTVHLFDSKFMSTVVHLDHPEAPRPVLVDRKLDVVGSETEEIKLPIPNPTLLPDRIIATMSPVLIIRHPIFTYTSYLRAATVFGATAFDSEFGLMTTYRWQRIIYDLYREYYDKTDPEGKKNWPIVIDGDKLVEDTKGQMQKFCALTGLDESQIQYSWNPSEEQLSTVYRAFVGTIKNSTGIIKTTDTSLDLEEHTKKWTEEWDEKVAKQLKEAVESSMEDYNYLYNVSI
ncbi:hypothetical protein EV361DRAFT_388128 [Lentinula raphanica]|uniref:Uncharacterized protein n=1 Tax=Lentinula raphanica TaxID=153919 RepID=A0AA38P3F3_9AGAR|nr:hypothetical protein FB446DRAFT_168678 [Lentinula raphanica]KAJ3835401.1 hypothetical protein F5878DRAFT_628018 [Lentinula raphanica]KAJ3968859.1 hypothetical protein EV361DRAFT_388128 [Lentinula raphanica]